MPTLTYDTEGNPYYIPDAVENKLYSSNLVVPSQQSYDIPLPVELPTSIADRIASGFGAIGGAIFGGTSAKDGQERYQTWPEKMVRSAVTLPHDVMTGKVDPTSEIGIERTQDLAGLAGVGPLAIKPGIASMGSGMTRMPKSELPELAIKAKEHFGITNNPKEAGFVMPDGSMLDLSGRHQQLDAYQKVGDRFVPKPGEKDYQRNKRDVDHSDLGFLYEQNNLLPDVSMSNTDIRSHFMSTVGAIRNNPGIGFETVFIPSPKQLKSIVSGHNQTYPGEPLSVDIIIPNAQMKIIAFKTFEKPTVEGISKWIREQAKDHPDIKPFAKLTPVEGNPFALKSDTNVGTGIAAVKNAPTFFTAIEAALPKIDMKAGTKEQWINAFKKYGTGKEEMQYTGLDSLPPGKLTKQQVEQHIAENRVELKDVWKGENNAFLNEAANEKYGKNYNELRDIQKQTLQEDFNIKLDPTKYSKYQMAGGENYKELLLTLPEKKYSEINTFQEFKSILGEIKTVADVALARRHNPNFRETVKNYTDGQVLDLVNKAKEMPEYQTPYVGTHWDEPNVLAHVRMNDRFVPDAASSSKYLTEIPSEWKIVKHPREEGFAIVNHKGEYGLNPDGRGEAKFLTKEKANEAIAEYAETQDGVKASDKGKSGLKTLHVEEIQSDWHQTGRKEGYGKKKGIIEPQGNDMWQIKWNDGTFSGGYGTKVAAETAMEYRGQGVPDAPFKANWDELALKKVIRHAIDNGYDAISWTPGKSQSTNPSKQMDHLNFKVTNDGKYILEPVDKHVNQLSVVERPVSANELETYVGKDITKRVIEEGKTKNFDSYGNYKIENADLEIGGTKEFYDKILVDKANKLGKQYGAKVEQKELSGNKYTIRQNPIYGRWEIVDKEGQVLGDFSSKDLALKKMPVETNTIHTMKITPEMRKAVQEKGFPLFSSSPILTPVDFDPFVKQNYKREMRARQHRLVPVSHDPFKT